MIQSEKLLLATKGTTYYTLTVSTNPSSATCTLSYDGTSYEGKSISVPSGTEISYSIYHSTYGTTTGTITMDADKTLSCTGTYSTSANGYIANIVKTGTLTYDSSTSALSGFANGSYATLPSNFLEAQVNSTSWETQWKFSVDNASMISGAGVFMDGCPSGTVSNQSGIGIRTVNPNITAFIDPANTSMLSNIVIAKTTANTTYWVKLMAEYVSSNQRKYSIWYKTSESASYTQAGNYLTSVPVIKSSYYNTYRIGNTSLTSPNCPWLGKIYLKDCYINIDGSRWWTGATPQINYNYYWNKTIS